MATPTQHRLVSERFLDHAEREFESGDLIQASEKAWGALAHYVNSVAKERGLPHGSHRDINTIATAMIQYLDDTKQPIESLTAANALHAHFYELFLTPEQVRAGLDSTRRLIANLRIAESRMPRSE